MRWLWIAMLVGCGSPAGGGESVAESESVAEAETESVAVTEAVTVTVTDSETDSVAESESDSVTDSETVTVTDSETDSVTESVTARAAGNALQAVPAGVDERDARMERLLRRGRIHAVERGHGGRSLAFRITLDDGTRGYFKPEQTFSGMHWFAEIAAYHLDRALGLRRTPVVVGRVFAWEDLRDAAGEDPRVPEIIVDEEGNVRGAFVEWIDERLVPLHLPLGWDACIGEGSEPTRWSSPRVFYAEEDRLARIERRELAAALATRSDALDAGTLEAGSRDAGRTDAGRTDAGRTDAGRTDAGRTDAGRVDAGRVDASAPSEAGACELEDERVAELSDVILFDYLTHNADRWGGNGTNLRLRGAGGPLVFLDNAAGFSARRARLRLMDARLESLRRFRRSTVDRVRRLSIDALATRLDAVPLAPILDASRLEDLETRRSALLAHVERVLREDGLDAYAWERASAPR